MVWRWPCWKKSDREENNVNEGTYDDQETQAIFQEIRPEMVKICARLEENDPTLVEVSGFIAKPKSISKNLFCVEAKALLEAVRTNRVAQKLLLVVAEGQLWGWESSLRECLTFNKTLQELTLVNSGLRDKGCLILSDILMENRTIHTLVLSRNEISNEGADAIGGILAGFNRKAAILGRCGRSPMRKLVLSLNHICSPVVLGQALLTNQSLKELDLSYNRIGAEGVARIAVGLRGNEALEVLDLSGNTDSSTPVTGYSAIFAECLAANHTLCELRLDYAQWPHLNLWEGRRSNWMESLVVLHMSHFRVDNNGAIAIGRALKTNTTLAELRLDCNKIGSVGSESIGKALRRNQTLKILCLSRNQVGDGGAFHIGKGLEENHSLCELRLDRNRVGDFGCMAIGSALGGDKCSLEILWLSKNDIGNVGVTAIGNGLVHNKTLQVLRLDENDIGDEGARDLLGRGLSNLEELSLEHNEIGDEGCLALAASLTDNGTPLQKIWLCHNRIGAVGAEALGEALVTNKHLKILGLDYNQTGGRGAVAIARGLSCDTCGLEHLWLSHNQVGDEGANALGQALAINKCLRDLRLDDNDISDAGALSIGTVGLAVNTFLETLWLCMNRSLGDVGTRKIFEGLATNGSLRTLLLSGNNITTAAMVSIQPLLAANHTLCEFDFCNNPIRDNDPTKTVIQSYLFRNRVGLWKIFRNDTASCAIWPLLIHTILIKENGLDLCFDLIRNRPEMVAWR